MTSDNASTPDGPDRLDWDRYEAELEAQAATSARTGGGTVDPNLATAGEGRVLVDPPAAQRPPRPGLAGLRAAQRRPVVPAWLRSRNELAQVCRWAAGFAAHTSAYHLTRTPTYAGRLAARAPRGTARLLGGWLQWLLDLEGEPVRQATVRAQTPRLIEAGPPRDGGSAGGPPHGFAPGRGVAPRSRCVCAPPPSRGPPGPADAAGRGRGSSGSPMLERPDVHRRPPHQRDGVRA